ncbi:transcriptional regulator ATRX homolog isoform X2 [Atheta coriaria]|uniref:transcriptional regulator ATRX homolog isoform X2 n=1 Tax=Dalotia coriaria TaxID=877792 RepID=UPI0031F3D6CA
MNEDEDPQQEGDEEVLLQSAQQMFEKLKNLVSTKKEKLSKNILSSIKKQIDNMYDDVHKNINDEMPNTSNCVESAGLASSEEVTESCDSIKKEPGDDDACNVGKIKVKSLSLLLDPNRHSSEPPKLDDSCIIVSSDSEQEAPIHSNHKDTANTEQHLAPSSSSLNSSSKVSKIIDNDADCDLSILTKPTDSASSLKHSPKRKSTRVRNSKPASIGNRDTSLSETSSENETDADQSSMRKSILKCSPANSSQLKSVQFAESEPTIHTYPCLPPVSESSSDTESNSDEDFNAKLTKKKKTRTKVVHPRKHMQFDEHIRVDDMGGLKRKREARKESSDSDQQNTRNRKKKRSQKVNEKKEDSDVSEDEETSENVKENGENGVEENCEGSNHTQDDENAPSSSNHQNTTNDSDSENEEVPEEICMEPEVILASDSDSEKKTASKSKKSKKKNDESDEWNEDPSSGSDVEKVPVTSKKKRGRAKRVLSDSDGSDADNTSKANESSDDSEKEDKEEEKKAPPKKSKRSRIKKVADSSDEEEKTTRKQLRKVISRDSLSDSTKQAEKDEAARKARIAERQEKYNNIFDPSKLEKSQQSKVVLDFNDETQEELLTVHPELVKHLKPHQGKGIQFMWDACFESLQRAKDTKGSGCVLAHCMGLGKTLQVITLAHTLLTNEEKTGVKKILVVCPLSTVLNWVAEFKKWLPDEDAFEVYNLVALKQNNGRASATMDWHKYGGVMVLGYDMFRNLSNETSKRMSKKMRLDFQKALVDPGADLVVCDEGHLLKNEKTTLSKAMNRIRTLRRIVLTGTPLQNNLKEYYCMVQFVKPNLLGTYKEYLNRFVNPITNGQYTDSTQTDISIMRRRSHVLHKLLDGTVQRRDYAVLAPFLPPKHEYVIFISLTDVQRSLYQHYLLNFAQRASGTRTSFLFTDFQELQRICTHPRVMLDKSIANKHKAEKNFDDDEEDSEGSLKDFIDDDSDTAESTDSDGSSDDSSKEKKAPTATRRRTRAMADQDPDPENLDGDDSAEPAKDEWWRQFTQTDELDNIIHSGKLSLLFEILHQCELIGDKILVFSQSLLSLNIIEYFLGKIDEAAQNGDSSMLKGYASSWSLGLDYFRLDGSSSCDNRAAWCKTFNDPSNTRARLFLISTRAGGLGINLVAANRVIIFDVSWNPSHDVQSIYRVYRFGQTKPSYIYRFVTLGTMEMKVYERQVIKQAISKRVIDEQQIDRHYNQNDLQELYKFEPIPEVRPLPAPPKDILLGELLQNFTDTIFKYHEHQSLLENKEDEVLNEDERKAAWEEFENEKKMHRTTTGTINNIPMHTVVLALTSIIKREHPGVTQLEINGVMPQLINEMREQLANGEMAPFNKMLAEIRTIKAAEQARVQEYYKSQQQAMWLAQQMQKQFPGLSQADAERILRDQMAQIAQRQMIPGPMRPEPPRISNPDEVVNLDED